MWEARCACPGEATHLSQITHLRVFGTRGKPTPRFVEQLLGLWKESCG
jgi:hypothetical protein